MYTPISCTYYDELEALATRRVPCHILYYEESGRRSEVHGIIRNLFTRNKEEFLELDNGLLIRLDRLISVNGKELKGYC